MSELKPCPFCGGQATLVSRAVSKYGTTLEYVVCCEEAPQYCVASSMHGFIANKSWAVEQWNRRAPDATLSAEVERLRNEADGEFVAAAVRVMRASPGFDHRDYQDGITADDFEMFFTEDMNEAWRLHEKERARAEAAEARVAELTTERDKARRYCSVSAYDMAGFAETLKANPDAFPRTAHDLMETSEFMRLAGEGREDGTVYDDELSKEKARVAELRSALSGIEDACEMLAASRSQDVYDAMIRDGQSGDLLVLWEARVRARRLLNQEQD